MAKRDLEKPRRPETMKRIEAEDEKWVVLSCTDCFRFFDAKNVGARLPGRCPDCRQEARRRINRACHHRKRIAA